MILNLMINNINDKTNKKIKPNKFEATHTQVATETDPQIFQH